VAASSPPADGMRASAAASPPRAPTSEEEVAARRLARGAISPLDHVRFPTASAFTFSRDDAPW